MQVPEFIVLKTCALLDPAKTVRSLKAGQTVRGEFYGRYVSGGWLTPKATLGGVEQGQSSLIFATPVQEKVTPAQIIVVQSLSPGKEPSDAATANKATESAPGSTSDVPMMPVPVAPRNSDALEAVETPELTPTAVARLDAKSLEPLAAELGLPKEADLDKLRKAIIADLTPSKE